MSISSSSPSHPGGGGLGLGLVKAEPLSPRPPDMTAGHAVHHGHHLTANRPSSANSHLSPGGPAMGSGMSPLFKGEYLLISDADSVLAAISPFPSFSCAYNERRKLVAGHASPIHPSSRHSPLPPGAPQLHHPLPQQQHGLLQVHQQQHLLSSPNGAGDTECMALSEVLRA